MTKKWSSTHSLDGQTKRQAVKAARRKASNEVEKWLKDQGAKESVTYDEHTGHRMRTFTIKLKQG